MQREDPNFVPPASVHAKTANAVNGKASSAVEKRPREDRMDEDERQLKKEKPSEDEDDEEMEIEDDEDGARQGTGATNGGAFSFSALVLFRSPTLFCRGIRRHAPGCTVSVGPAPMYKFTSRSDRRCAFGPVSTVRYSPS